jgi:hypothetical protein
MNALLPIIRLGTPGMRWGVPAIMFATSSFDLPQNEQWNPLAFILAIIHQVSKPRALFSVRDYLIY